MLEKKEKGREEIRKKERYRKQRTETKMIDKLRKKRRKGMKRTGR